jgi:hypothetical protein
MTKTKKPGRYNAPDHPRAVYRDVEILPCIGFKEVEEKGAEEVGRIYG